MAGNGAATPAAGQLLQCNGTTYFVPSTAVSAVDTTTTLLANISGNLRSVSPYAAATLSGVAPVSIYFFLLFVKITRDSRGSRLDLEMAEK